MNPKNSKYNTVLTAFHLVEPSDSLKKKNTPATISVTNANIKISLNMNHPFKLKAAVSTTRASSMSTSL